jgi:hypothetical protein
VLSHHDQQASDDQNQTQHGQMLSSSMLLLNLILPNRRDSFNTHRLPMFKEKW